MAGGSTTLSRSRSATPGCRIGNGQPTPSTVVVGTAAGVGAVAGLDAVELEDGWPSPQKDKRGRGKIQ